MRTESENPPEGIALGPCQVCHELKNRFYLCAQNHSTCEDCMKTDRALSDRALSPSMGKGKRFPLPETPEHSPQPPVVPKIRLSPASTSSLNLNSEEDIEFAVQRKISPRRSRSPSNDPPSIFSSRSPIKSLVVIPKPSRIEPEEPDSESEEDWSDIFEIFCAACDDVVEVTLMNLSVNMLKSLVRKPSDPVDDFHEDPKEVEEDSDDAESVVPTTSIELYDDDGLRRDVDELRIGLATTYSELITTRSELDEVIYATEKLEMDVDMLKGGVNYIYFNFDTVLKRGEVRTEEKVCGIPFVIMVRMRNVTRVPHLGFFIGLEPYEGRSHSPLKKIIVLRAHNAYGKVIEKHALETFENGQCVHPCFDLTTRQDGSLFGYANFLKKDRIMKPDMLKDGRLCLSLQIQVSL